MAHPFFSSLSVALRTAAGHAGVPAGSSEIITLTGVYVGPWLEAGYPRAGVDRSLSLALRIAPVSRAMA